MAVRTNTYAFSVKIGMSLPTGDPYPPDKKKAR
jgi:hypothetical protein